MEDFTVKKKIIAGAGLVALAVPFPFYLGYVTRFFHWATGGVLVEHKTIEFDAGSHVEALLTTVSINKHSVFLSSPTEIKVHHFGGRKVIQDESHFEILEDGKIKIDLVMEY